MDRKAEELSAMVEEIRSRVRALHPGGGSEPGVPLADLMPLAVARDAAEGKVASIGTVNPRPGGFKNSMIQSVKRNVARALDWHVREQVEFNRAAMDCVQATFEALSETNRALATVLHASQSRDEASRAAVAACEEKVTAQEIQYTRNLAELQRAFEYRVMQTDSAYRQSLSSIESAFRDLFKAQHGEFTGALDRGLVSLQDDARGQLRRIRGELESMIHSDLRVLRQRAVAIPQPEPSAPAPSPKNDWSHVDWLRFSERFRGSEDYVRGQQRLYAQRFAGLDPVLDIGCGRGELLETFREAGIPARGIELSAELTAICRSKGLDATEADLYEYLAGLPDRSLGGIVCSQVVEHLPRPRVPELVRLASAKLRRGGLLAIETPNPECLAIFATHFYLDPTHRHPLPPALMSFYFEEAGFVNIEIERLSPASASMPELAALPADFRDRFFGGLDYAIFGSAVSSS